jgi:hypothetical protein
MAQTGMIMFHDRVFALLLAGVCLSAAKVQANATEAGAGTTIQLQVEQVYYELPHWCVGAKLTAYASDYAGGDYPSDRQRAKRTTPDGKNWLTCIQEMKLGFVGASMVSQGRPPNKGKPDPHYDDWRVAAGAVVASGGGLMLEYMAGVGLPPGMPRGTTNAPELANNVDPDPGPWRVQNCLDWADYMVSLHGAEKLRLVEFYNEPATMNDWQMGSYSGTYWYSSKEFKRYDRLCADWAANHQQDYYQPLKAKYPHTIICGGSYSDPAGRYNAGEAPRYLRGYPGARISTSNPNTKYQDALSLHGYGFQTGSNAFNTPGAPAGGVQAIFNSIFYPTLKNPGMVSGYRAGVDQWLGFVRPLERGTTNKLVNTEWWAYSPEGVGGWYPTGGKEGSRQAVADVLGWIVHCQNADQWQFEAIQYHAVNVCSGRKTDPQGRPAEMNLPDAFFCESDGKLWRLGRYYAVKDICCRFANQYPRLLRCRVQGPPSPPSSRNNSPGTQIQACAGSNQDTTAVAICLANIGDTKQVITVSFGRRAAGDLRGIQVPPELKPETPLSPLSGLSFRDAKQDSIVLTLHGYSAALVEIHL